MKNGNENINNILYILMEEFNSDVKITATSSGMDLPVITIDGTPAKVLATTADIVVEVLKRVYPKDIDAQLDNLQLMFKDVESLLKGKGGIRIEDL